MSDLPNTTLVSNGETETPFYTSEEPVAGTKEGWIADSNTAQEVADLERVPRAREDALLKESETGLTEAEKQNIEVMNVIAESFPYAVKKSVDPKTGEVSYEAGDFVIPPVVIKDKEIEERIIKEHQELNDVTKKNMDNLSQKLLNDSGDPLDREKVLISKNGIQFFGEVGTIYQYGSLPLEIRNNLLRVFTHINKRGEIVKAQMDQDAFSIDRLKKDIQKAKEDSLL